MTLAASSKKAHLRELASISSTPDIPMIASTRPGKPAPLPRSIRRQLLDGNQRYSCAESNIWRRHTSSSVRTPTKLTESCHFLRSPTKPINRSNVSRETLAADKNSSGVMNEPRPCSPKLLTRTRLRVSQ